MKEAADTRKLYILYSQACTCDSMSTHAQNERFKQRQMDRGCSGRGPRLWRLQETGVFSAKNQTIPELQEKDDCTKEQMSLNFTPQKRGSFMYVNYISQSYYLKEITTEF